MALRTLVGLLCVCVVTSGCFSPAGGMCAAMAECDDDTAGFPFGLDSVGSSDDSANVCVAENEGFVRSLRANEEEDCQRAADAWEAYMVCAGREFSEGEDCDQFRLDNNNPCEEELEDFFDAFQDAEGDCSSSEE